jgi:sigma-B regulation protein RsbU (phosphoserine phosphatase)
MRILIAEDSQTQALDLRRRLEAMGHDVVVTADGLQAWNQLWDRPERLVILDWMMPVMNGLDLCRKIRDEIKSTYIYVILLTAKTHRHERLQGLSAGADDFGSSVFWCEHPGICGPSYWLTGRGPFSPAFALIPGRSMIS